MFLQMIQTIYRYPTLHNWALLALCFLNLLLLYRTLLLPHRRIPSSQQQKLVVRTPFDNLSVVKDNDLVRFGDGGQTMSSGKQVSISEIHS